ncbi:hypothetical protein [Paenibacillus sp. J2TS4]|uniref:hypothetical protein n=1 Tax=Paenibacillus sp. J2TS4 TaxID=2807194 RepID=UPI001B16E428|nr:hypothetical protein [Paenibacillus sp. J2TS4]GIP33635.1 hypothetical protein J2TS4_28450 [Paenibacillus sp. J2TS4]
MKIIEEKTVSKTGNRDTCEDRYCVTGHYACVIDGATNVSGRIYNGLTPGQIASGVIAKTIPTLPPDADISEIVKSINDNLIHYYKAHGIYDSILENPFSCPTASMVLYSKSRHTIWMIGDCQCMIDDKWYTNAKIVDDIIANIRSFVLEVELQRGKTIEELMKKDTGHEAVRSFKRMQYYLQNTEVETQYSYIALTGFEFNLDSIETLYVDPVAKYLVLASDGYPGLKPTLEETEKELEYILKNDPLCFREYKLGKGLIEGNVSFDDRTYVKVKLD